MARCFPPEREERVLQVKSGVHYGSNSVWFRMLRPELLRILKEGEEPLCQPLCAPLSPDALTGWGRSDMLVFNERVSFATEYMLKSQIPLLTTHLIQVDIDNVEISFCFHRFGVNLRHLGLVICHLISMLERNAAFRWCPIVDNKLEKDFLELKTEFTPRPQNKSIVSSGNVKLLDALVIDMMSRTLKNLVRAFLRGERKSAHNNLHSYCTHIASASTFDSLQVEMASRFGVVPSKCFISRNNLLRAAFLRAFTSCGITLSPLGDVHRSDSSSDIIFVASDFVDFTSCLKRIPYIDVLEAKVADDRMARSISSADKAANGRSAVSYYQRAFRSHSENEDLKSLVADCLLRYISVESSPSHYYLGLYSALSMNAYTQVPKLNDIYEAILNSIGEKCVSSVFLEETLNAAIQKYPARNPLSILAICKLIKMGVHISSSTLSFFCESVMTSINLNTPKPIQDYNLEFIRKWLQFYCIVLLDIRSRQSPIPLKYLDAMKTALRTCRGVDGFQPTPWEKLLMCLYEMKTEETTTTKHSVDFLKLLHCQGDFDATSDTDLLHLRCLQKYFNATTSMDLMIKAHFLCEESQNDQGSNYSCSILLRDYAFFLANLPGFSSGVTHIYPEDLPFIHAAAENLPPIFLARGLKVSATVLDVEGCGLRQFGFNQSNLIRIRSHVGEGTLLFPLRLVLQIGDTSIDALVDLTKISSYDYTTDLLCMRSELDELKSFKLKVFYGSFELEGSPFLIDCAQYDISLIETHFDQSVLYQKVLDIWMGGAVFQCVRNGNSYGEISEHIGNEIHEVVSSEKLKALMLNPVRIMYCCLSTNTPLKLLVAVRSQDGQSQVMLLQFPSEERTSKLSIFSGFCDVSCVAFTENDDCFFVLDRQFYVDGTSSALVSVFETSTSSFGRMLYVDAMVELDLQSIQTFAQNLHVNLELDMLLICDNLQVGTVKVFATSHGAARGQLVLPESEFPVKRLKGDCSLDPCEVCASSKTKEVYVSHVSVPKIFCYNMSLQCIRVIDLGLSPISMRINGLGLVFLARDDADAIRLVHVTPGPNQQDHNKIKENRLSLQWVPNETLLERIFVNSTKLTLSTVLKSSDLNSKVLMLKGLNLAYFNLSSGQISAEFADVEWIDLSNNDFCVLRGEFGTFAGLSKLKILDLSHCSLSHFNGKVFGDLKSLEVLNIQGHRLIRLPDNFFVGLESLVSVDLSSGYLDELSSFQFESLKSLKFLYLQKNRISSIDHDVFSQLQSIEEINLAENRLQNVDPNIFSGLKNLKLV
eukprot:TRINITY_DN3207_c0_g1_i21.p1 TRINITY_DN3207_c0_g1~~TRINITY_DN3207_c0_g1_i21.p1  ORF type:complete len:1273 (-),score=264.31 TRINITY_DN3207_c0_g1_i21:705-4523(-)